MKSLKWEGTGTKNLFPHTSILEFCRLPVSLAELAVEAPRRDARRNSRIGRSSLGRVAAACTADSREASKAERTVEDASTAADRSGVKHHRGNSVLFAVTTFLLQAGAAAEILVSCLVLLFAIAHCITFRVVKSRFVSPVKIHLCLEKSET